jgi:hypothetical protein
MSDHEQQQIADLTERLLATREQREDWAKFALDMQRERDAARADNEFARAEWEAWEAKACGLDRECKKLKAERDAARREFIEWIDTTREELDAHADVVADRDRLAACVERVRGACERAGHWVEKADGRGSSCYVMHADILAALEGTNG